MYLYNPLRVRTRTIRRKPRFAPLPESNANEQSDVLDCNFQNHGQPSEWEETGDSKIDNWMESQYDITKSPKTIKSSKIKNSVNSIYCRLSPSRRNISCRKIRKIVSGITCFQLNPAKETGPETSTNGSAILRSTGSQQTHVLGQTYDEKSTCDLRINVRSFSRQDNDDWSTTRSTVDESEIISAQPIRKLRKFRQVTRYHSTNVIDRRTPQAALYYSRKSGLAQSVHSNHSEGGLRIRPIKKEAVGRHLEWLKFLA